MDIVALFNTALAAAIAEQIKPLIDANKELTQRVAALELAHWMDDNTGMVSHAPFGDEPVAPRDPKELPAGTEPGSAEPSDLVRTIDSIETVLGAVFELSNLHAVAQAVKDGNPDGLRLAEQMQYRIKRIAEDVVDQHQESYNHDEFFKTADEVAEALSEDSSALSTLADALNESGEINAEADEDSVERIVRSVIRNDVTISIDC